MIKNNKKVLIAVKIIIAISLIISLINFIIIFSTKSKNKTPKLSCQEEYTLVNNKCLKEVKRINAEVEYACPSGYQLVNDKCIKYEYGNGNTNTSCPSGYQYNSNTNKCYKMEYKMPDTGAPYTCYDGFELNTRNNTCIKLNPQNPQPDPIISYECNIFDGYTEQLKFPNKCSKFYSVADSNNNCPIGTQRYIDGPSYNPFVTCYLVKEKERVIKTPICASGYYYDKNIKLCINPQFHKPIPSFSCPAGWTKRSDEICEKETTVPPKVTTICEGGYTYKNGKCIKEIENNKILKYKCNSNYKLENDMCVQYDIQEPKEGK